MKSMESPEMDLLFEAILTLQTPEECYLFFQDVCTIKELEAMTQRFAVACQLSAGKNYQQVYQDTGVSSATICRVNKCLQYGDGGYKTALRRLKEAGKLEYDQQLDADP